MALKDWKKINRDKGWIQYINKKNQEYVLNLEKTLDIERNSNLWIISIRKNSISMLPQDKLFKTNSQALKYAKEYMRKH